MTEGVEVEIKLAVERPDAIRSLIHEPHPGLLGGFATGSPVREVVVTDRYLDTAAGALDGHDARARLRESRGSVVLTFKRAGLVRDGITERVELEAPATSDLDPARWPASEARAAVLEIVGAAPLVETARLRQRRLVRDLRRDDATVELSLDELEALDADVVVARRWELEAELKDGAREALEELAAALQRLPGLSLATESKRAFAMGAVARARAER